MTAVRVQRTIAAPPERVYRAWLEPDTVQRWMAPRGFHAARAEVDERIGGRIRVWHRDDADQDVGGGVGEIAELVPSERIVLRWWFTGPDDDLDPVQETRLTVTFEPADGGTLVTLVHDQIDGLASVHPEIAGGIEEGWTQALASLATEMEN